jgi:hypothetical protein
MADVAGTFLDGTRQKSALFQVYIFIPEKAIAAYPISNKKDYFAKSLPRV